MQLKNIYICMNLNVKCQNYQDIHVVMINHVRDLQPLGKDLLVVRGDVSEQHFPYYVGL